MKKGFGSDEQRRAAFANMNNQQPKPKTSNISPDTINIKSVDRTLPLKQDDEIVGLENENGEMMLQVEEKTDNVMDKTQDYADQCFSLPEHVLEDWNWAFGDLVYDDYMKRITVFGVDGVDGDCIPLPRQDQLVSMTRYKALKHVKYHNGFDQSSSPNGYVAIHQVKLFNEFLITNSEYVEKAGFDSREQLLLAYLMHLKYGMKWDVKTKTWR